LVSTAAEANTVSIIRAEIAKQLPYVSKCYITLTTTTGTFTDVKTPTVEMCEKFVSCLSVKLPLDFFNFYSLLFPVQVTQ
jgi:hypothetical protein